MQIEIGNKRTPLLVTLDPRIKDWFISCATGPTIHFTFKEEDFKNYQDVSDYTKQLSKQIGGIKITPSAEHFFFEVKDFGDEILRVIE